jgi:hypothetical protein
MQKKPSSKFRTVTRDPDGAVVGEIARGFMPAGKNLARVLFGPLALEDLRGP